MEEKEQKVLTMEQLAHFVTKSFEYNNNNSRVLDVLNLTTKSGIFDHLKSNDSMDTLSNPDSDDNDADSVDIDITDVSSNEGNDDPKIHNENDNNNINVIRRTSPSKKSSKENQKLLTRNWLISDTPKKKCDNGLFSTLNFWSLRRRLLFNLKWIIFFLKTSWSYSIL